MFTPKNIQVALEELFDLCDPDYMMDMLENYGEEFDDISLHFRREHFRTVLKWYVNTECCLLLMKVSTIEEKCFWVTEP